MWTRQRASTMCRMGANRRNGNTPHFRGPRPSRDARLRPVQNRDVVAVPPLDSRHGPRGRVDDDPCAVRGPEDGDVGLAVAVVIAGHRLVAPVPPLNPDGGPGARVDDEPGAVRGPEDGDVNPAVAVV